MALAQILHRRGTSAEWSAANPVLASGEFGYDTTAKRAKVGDGQNSWSALQWVTMSAAEVARLEAAATALEGAASPYDAATATILGQANSASRKVLSDTIGEVGDARYARYVGPVYYLDLYRDFIMGPWVTGQANTATTIAADAAVGATTLTVASGATYPNNSILLVNPGTASQRQYKVTAGGGTNTLTVTPAVSVALPAGTPINTLWGDSSHLNESTALARFITTAKRADGTDVIQNPGTRPVVLLGNSWFVGGGSAIAAAITAKYPGATVINKGINGNNSNQVLARFDTDVPSNSAYVLINEPGVNDAAHGAQTFRDQSMRNLAALVAKVRAIGAIPVVIGPPPLALYPHTALDNATWMREALASPTYPDVPASALTRTFVMPAAPSAQSVAIGVGSQRQVTTADENVSLGNGTLLENFTAGGNVAVGNNAARSLTGGNGQNVFIGNIAGFGGLTCGRNVFIGASAGYPSPANSTRAASNNVAVGWQAGGSDANDPGDYTAVGAESRAAASGAAFGRAAVASGAGATALGRGTTAAFNGSVAIGRDNQSVSAIAEAINEFALGTALHLVKVRGRLNVAPRTPSGSSDAQGSVGDITSDDSYVYVKTSTGWKRAALAAW